MHSQPPQRITHDAATNRDLWLWQTHAASDVQDVERHLPNHAFVCLLVWDATTETVETVSDVTEALIRAGCVYLCTSGEDCERVHDICDENICEMIGDGERSMDEVGLIMTTWHADEPLDEALWFFLRSTIPADNFVDRCRTSLVLTVGLDRDRMQTIERALADPEGFSSEIENRPDSW